MIKKQLQNALACSRSVGEENRREVGRLKAENRRAEAELVVEQTTVAQLNDFMSSKDDELASIRVQPQQVDTSSSTGTRLRYLSQLWQQSSSATFGNKSKRKFEVGWKYLSFDGLEPTRRWQTSVATISLWLTVDQEPCSCTISIHIAMMERRISHMGIGNLTI